jgi:hypothetical protein
MSIQVADKKFKGGGKRVELCFLLSPSQKAPSVFFSSLINNNDNRFFHLSNPTAGNKNSRPDRL